MLDAGRVLEGLDVNVKTGVDETLELVLPARVELTNVEVDELLVDKLDTDPSVPFLM